MTNGPSPRSPARGHPPSLLQLEHTGAHVSVRTVRRPTERHGAAGWNGRQAADALSRAALTGRRPTGAPCRPRLVDKVLGLARVPGPFRRLCRLPRCVATLTHGPEGAAGFHRSKEAVGQSELSLDDEGSDVVGQVPGGPTRDASRRCGRLALHRDPRRGVPLVTGLLKGHLHDDQRYEPL